MLTLVAAGLLAAAPVPPEWKSCRQASDCVAVDTHCESCCRYEAVRKDHVRQLERLMMRTCLKTAQKQKCNCVGEAPTVGCVDRKCVARKPPKDDPAPL